MTHLWVQEQPLLIALITMQKKNKVEYFGSEISKEQCEYAEERIAKENQKYAYHQVSLFDYM